MQVRTISEMKPKPFNEDNMQSVDDLYAQIEEGGIHELAIEFI
ncbi:hypothetical protein [Paenibacillus larvae]|nr:hypothetical protein [Paenibacillus larvae]